MVCSGIEYGTRECEEYLARMRQEKTFRLLEEKDSQELVAWAKRTISQVFGHGLLHMELVLMMLSPKDDVSSVSVDAHVQVLCAWALLSQYMSLQEADQFARRFTRDVTRRALAFSDFVRYHVVKYLHHRRKVVSGGLQ